MTLNRRPSAQRPQRTLLLSVEGATERQYITLLFRDRCAANDVDIQFALHTGTRPCQILKSMEGKMKENPAFADCDAWLVLDMDRNTDADLRPLHKWTQKAPDKRGLALSNPCFEYWLLLHLEEHSDAADCNGYTQKMKKRQNCADCKAGKKCDVCKKRIKWHNYTKGAFRNEQVEDLINGLPAAIERASKRDTPRCADWPRIHGSTMYRLAKKLQNPAAPQQSP